MVLIWIFVAVLIAAIIYLNYMCVQIIQSSQIHSLEKKQKLLLIVWSLPILGVFIALFQINKDIKKNREKVEGEIAPAIRELADKLRVLESDIQKEKLKEEQRQQQKSDDDQIH